MASKIERLKEKIDFRKMILGISLALTTASFFAFYQFKTTFLGIISLLFTVSLLCIFIDIIKIYLKIKCIRDIEKDNY